MRSIPRGQMLSAGNDRVRVLVILRLGWAVVLLVWRARVGSRRPRGNVESAAAAALAVRELVEAGATAVRWREEPPRWPGVLDAIHAASMVPVAAASERLRRHALTSAAIASMFAFLSR